MLSGTHPVQALTLRPLLLALQWTALLLMTASLATRSWYHDGWIPLVLLVIATLLWANELRAGLRRWWFFYVAGIFLYTLLRSGADNSGFPVRTEYVINIDRWMFRGTEPVVWLQSHMFSPTHIDAFDWLTTQVHWSFFVAPHAVAIAIYIWRRELFPRYAQLVLGVMYVGLIFFYVVPTTPPWLAAQQGAFGVGPVYRVMDFVGGSIDPQAYRSLYSSLGEPNSVAAVPSIHMAVTFAVFLWVRRYFRPLAPLFLVYSIVMGLSLMHLAEHYAFDVLVGMLCALVVDFALERIDQWRRRPAAVTTVSPPER
jgi:hypothetical protein